MRCESIESYLRKDVASHGTGRVHSTRKEIFRSVDLHNGLAEIYRTRMRGPLTRLTQLDGAIDLPVSNRGPACKAQTRYQAVAG